MRILTWMLAASLLPGLAWAARADDSQEARDREGLRAFQAYLKQHYPGKKWQVGPSRLDGPALHAAYPRQRFYYVYSTPPLPPGAEIQGVQDGYQRQLEDILKNYISLAARVDDRGQVAPLAGAADYNAGLMKVTGDEDARTAAAAILSLCSADQVGPGTVDPGEVRVTRTDQGWSCRVNGRGMFQGTVVFDRAGKCVAVSKFYTGPLPA